MAATVIIPARAGLPGFPAKIVASDTGRPLVQHVVDQAKKCSRVKDVIVATDDQRIVDALRPFETRVVMTSPTHQSGTDRIAEVARGLSSEIVVNVQGDEPEIEPETIDALVNRLESTPSDDMATAATRFRAGADPKDPNLVKVVIGEEGRAIYFSRSPIPFWREPDFAENAAYYLHLGIYAYRRDFLLKFAAWPPTPLEKTEKLEQLRALEHGRSIYVLKVDRATHGIDTPGQYAAFVRRVTGRGVALDGTQWTCPQCQERVPANFDLCWNCGTDKDGVTDPNFAPVADGFSPWCENCGYPLYGLPTQMCPECGQEFSITPVDPRRFKPSHNDEPSKTP